MARQRDLKNAPITEAIIDIRVKLPKSFEIDKFRSLKTELSDRYPIIDEYRIFSEHHKITSGKPQIGTIEEGVLGYFYKSADKKEIVQFRRDGFTVNRLHPYTKWDDLIAKAKNLWPKYRQIAVPEAVTRLAARFINNLKLPLPIKDFSEYLSVAPDIPAGLPQEVTNFLNRITIHDSTQDISANITQILVKWLQPSKYQNNHIELILDIEVYKQGDFSMADLEIWDHFEKFRKMKNEIFFNYITEKTARLFE